MDDGYFGSGKLLKYAIQKYGLENFVTNILFIFDEEWKMNLAEKILVVPDIETNYNLCPGGKGGFGYINSSDKKSEWSSKSGKKTAECILKKYGNDYFFNCGNKFNDNVRNKGKNNFLDKNIQKIATDKSKTDISKMKRLETLKNINHQQGSKNSQYGTCWITNKIENKKILKKDFDKWILKGFVRGRTVFKKESL